MTYLRAESPLWEALSCWWRCQDRTLDEQIAAGVRWFDIRLVYNAKPDGALWKFAHGAVDLVDDGAAGGAAVVQPRTERGELVGLKGVLERIQACGGLARIMLERGDERDEELFAEYFAPSRIGGKWPCITGAVIKKGWRVLWRRNEPRLMDCSYVPYKRDTAWWRQLRGLIGFPWRSLKRRAMAGTRPTEWHKEGEGTAWIFDYV